MTACNGNTIKVMEIPSDSISQVTVYRYDFFNQTYERFSYYNNSKHIIEVVNCLNNLSGRKTDLPEYDGNESITFGFEFSSHEEYSVSIIGQNLIKDNGEIYIVDMDEMTDLLSKFEKDSKQNVELKRVVNHREISLIDDEWNSIYMIPSSRGDDELDSIEMSGDIESVDDNLVVNYDMINHSEYEIEYGLALEVEVLINDTWYMINDMTLGNSDFAWTEEGHILMPGQTIQYKDGFLKYYEPLPSGRYRLLKDVYSQDERYFITWEFDL